MEGLLSQADRLYEQRALPQLHDTMNRALQADGSDPRVLWPGGWAVQMSLTDH